MTTRFPTEEHWSYQIGLRSHNPELTTKKRGSLTKDQKYRLWPYYNGRKIFFDLWFAPTKSAIKNIKVKYEWVLSSPDGKQVFKSGEGTVNLSPLSKCKEVLDLGHFSIASQYKIDIKFTNSMDNDVINYEPVDFTVNDFGQLGHTVLLAVVIVIITVVVTTILTTCMAVFGFKK